jgi:hypothetical protein
VEPPTVLGTTPSMSKTETTADSSTVPGYTSNGVSISAKAPPSAKEAWEAEAKKAGLSLSEYIYRRVQEGRGRDVGDPAGDLNAPKNPKGLTSDAVDPDGTEAGEFWCPDCGARVTRSPVDPNIEYGHRAGHAPDTNDGERCPRRPAAVDTDDGRVKSALSMHESMGIGRFADREEREGRARHER